jgi:hypothetical protein
MPWVITLASREFAAASSLVEAAEKELMAALTLADRNRVEAARSKCVSAYEVRCDRQIALVQLMQKVLHL